MKTKLVVFLAILAICVLDISGQKAEPNRINFAKGKTSAAVSGKLSNDQEMDFVFAAKAGQKISLKVSSNPGENLFDFSLKGDSFDLQTDYDYYTQYSFTAPETGDYLVFVRKRPTEKVKSAKFYLALTIK